MYGGRREDVFNGVQLWRNMQLMIQNPMLGVVVCNNRDRGVNGV